MHTLHTQPILFLFLAYSNVSKEPLENPENNRVKTNLRNSALQLYDSINLANSSA